MTNGEESAFGSGVNVDFISFSDLVETSEISSTEVNEAFHQDCECVWPAKFLYFVYFLCWLPHILRKLATPIVDKPVVLWHIQIVPPIYSNRRLHVGQAQIGKPHDFLNGLLLENVRGSSVGCKLFIKGLSSILFFCAETVHKGIRNPDGWVKILHSYGT